VGCRRSGRFTTAETRLVEPLLFNTTAGENAPPQTRSDRPALEGRKLSATVRPPSWLSFLPDFANRSRIRSHARTPSATAPRTRNPFATSQPPRDETSRASASPQGDSNVTPFDAITAGVRAPPLRASADRDARHGGPCQPPDEPPTTADLPALRADPIEPSILAGPVTRSRCDGSSEIFESPCDCADSAPAFYIPGGATSRFDSSSRENSRVGRCSV